MNKTKPYIVSISAVAGGGKSTITNRLKERLPGSKALFFDEYDFEEYPKDICDWVEKGSDYSEWNLDPLINDINKLLLSNENFEYILLDYPFSRLHGDINNYIDCSIFIDTPLDVAMARRILRDFNKSSTEEVLNDMRNYLSRGRHAYLAMLKDEKSSSDVIVDGTKPVETIVNEIYEIIRRESQHFDEVKSFV
ncbi:hypothetical protein [Cohnella panacarvi]|uniref:hypothetical protein n=1 Tax=Cohnella panacarvi TaxID=400776 RepID=UPI000479586F|nr:hypothetical protein [Cohnella panacarvi]